MAIVAGLLPFSDVVVSTSPDVRGFAIVLILLGAFGIVGVISGLAAIAVFPLLSKVWRKRLSLGIWSGIVALIPAFMVSIMTSLYAILSVIGMAISCVLLLRILRDA